MLDFLRAIRSIITKVSSAKILGIHVDLLLHFLFSFLLILILHKKFSLKSSIVIVSVLLVLKELGDIFIKSRLEYIRPPALDLPLDLFSGFCGILLAYLLIKKKGNKQTIYSHSKSKTDI